MAKAKEQGIDFLSPDFSNLNTEGDVSLIMKLSEYPKIIETAAISHEPHRVAFYLQELASEFHSYWGKGNTDESKRIIVDNVEISKARVALAQAVSLVIKNGLNTLGIKAVEKM